MPPLTPEEIENDQTLDSKLGAFFQAEQADLPATDTSPVEPEATVETPEPEVAAEDETPEPEQKLYAGKYRSDEELEQAYLHLQSLQGKSSQELGELRQIVQQIQESQQRPVPQHVDWEAAADTNPAYAAEVALANQDTFGLAKVKEVWDSTSPGAYDLWAQGKRLEARLNELSEQTAPLQQHAQTTQSQTIAQEAFLAYERENPDARRLASEMMQVAEQSPRILSVLATGDDVEAMKEVYDFLYTKAERNMRGRDSDTLAQAKAARDAEQQDKSRTAKQNAAVGTTTSTPEEQKAKTGVDLWREQFAQVGNGNSIAAGLTTD